MTQIDFYLLPRDGSLGMISAVGRIADKATAKGHQIFVQVKDETEGVEFQKGLWDFRPEAFLPHSIQGSKIDETVIIGWDAPAQDHDDVMINTTGAIPDHFSRFRRLIEMVQHDEVNLAASREAWRFYRDRGYPLTKHDL